MSTGSTAVSTVAPATPKAQGIAWGQLPTFLNRVTGEIVGMFKVRHTQPNPSPGAGMDVHPEDRSLPKQLVSFAWHALMNIQPGDILTIARDGSIAHMAVDLAELLLRPANPTDPDQAPAPLPVVVNSVDTQSMTATQVQQALGRPVTVASDSNMEQSQPKHGAFGLNTRQDFSGQVDLCHLPAWQCHKVVRAAKITEILPPSATGITELIFGEAPKVDFNSQIASGKFGLDWMKHFQPEVGGYIVQYDNGYVAWSPAKAFEDGYAPITQPPGIEPSGSGGGRPDMHALMRAKMLVINVTQWDNFGGETIEMIAVGGDKVRNGYPNNGADEDNTFAHFTPDASLRISIVNPDLLGKIKRDSKYYLDFLLASEAPAAAQLPAAPGSEATMPPGGWPRAADPVNPLPVATPPQEPPTPEPLSSSSGSSSSSAEPAPAETPAPVDSSASSSSASSAAAEPIAASPAN